MGRRGSSRIRDVTELGSPPRADELELTIIGPGHGESVVVHTGDGRWAVVDSCVNAKTGEPRALGYLNAVGVDPADSVDLVVATHWHEDHVRGMGQLTATCCRAAFCCPAVFANRELLRFIGTRQGYDVGQDGIWAKEMRDVLSAVLHGKARPRFAIANRRVLRRGECEVWSLSPSDGAAVRSARYVSTILSAKVRTEVPSGTLSPNQASVALWIKMGDVKVLLGADLERAGWIEILRSSTRPQGRASVFKIPHHGSDNAHESRVWDKMTTRGPVAVVTPFGKGRNRPPTRKQLQKILDMTKDAYITAEPRAAQSVKTLNQEAGKRSLDEPGIVRLRRGLESPDGWKVEMFGGACHLQNYLTRTADE